MSRLDAAISQMIRAIAAEPDRILEIFRKYSAVMFIYAISLSFVLSAWHKQLGGSGDYQYLSYVCGGLLIVSGVLTVALKKNWSEALEIIFAPVGLAVIFVIYAVIFLPHSRLVPADSAVGFSISIIISLLIAHGLIAVIAFAIRCSVQWISRIASLLDKVFPEYSLTPICIIVFLVTQGYGWFR